MFVEGSNFVNLLHTKHRQSSKSREDLYLNYEDGSMLFTSPIMTETFAASICNDDVKYFNEIIVKEIRVILYYHKENQEDIFL